MAHQYLSVGTRLLAGLLILGSSLAAAQTYRWVDPASGRTMYTDTPPPGSAAQVRKTLTAPPNGEKELPYATRLASQKFPITLYTGANCTPCNEARELLTKRNIPFTEKSLHSEADLAELKALVGDTSVPCLKVGRQSVKGFESGAYNNALDLAGYPKAPKAAQ